MAKGRILHELSLSAIAAVDHPCQEHAKMTIIKRANTRFTKSSALRSELAKLDIPAARGFAEILAANEAQAECWEAESAMWPLFDALRQSLSSIAVDANIDATAKIARVEESVTQFVAALKAEWPDVAEEVSKIAKVSPNSDRMTLFITAGTAGSTKEAMMADKTPAELLKSVEDLTAQITKATADLATANADLAKAKQCIDDETMEDATGKPTKKGADFLAKHAPAGIDEILKIGDASISKSAVGEPTFLIMKAQQDQIAKERDLRIDSEMAKRATEEFPSIVGTAAEKGAVLKYLESAPEPVKKSAEAILKAAEAATKGAFANAGTGGGQQQGQVDIAKARTDFMAKVSEIMARDKVTKTSALSKAQVEHPALFKAYQGQADEAMAA